MGHLLAARTEAAAAVEWPVKVHNCLVVVVENFHVERSMTPTALTCATLKFLV